MRGKLFCLILLSFFLVGNVFALTTVVEVKTLPHHWIFITPIATSEGYSALAQPQKGFSSQYGDVKFELNVDESYFDLNFLIKDGDNFVFTEKIRENFISGTLIEVEVLPEGVESLVKPNQVIEEVEEIMEDTFNETNVSVEEEIELNIENENLKKIIMNGYSIIEENKPIVNSIYYSVLGFTALFLIFLTIRRNGKKVEKIEKKKGDIEKISGEDEDEKALEEAKAKVKELEGKKENKITAAKKKLIEDQEELLRLRGTKEKERKEEVSSDDMRKRLKEKINSNLENKADENYKDFQKDNEYKRKDWKK